MSEIKVLPTSFWAFTLQEAYAQLQSSENGLSPDQVQKLAHKSLPKHTHAKAVWQDIRLLLGQFKSPLMILLLGAVVLSAVLGDTSDVAIILLILFSTAFISFVQERNASAVVRKLQAMISITSKVLRNGIEITIPSTEILPGDVLIVHAGDRVPADCLLIDANELHANEASLTGESYPVRKIPSILSGDTQLSKRSNCLWQGTNIVSGSARALVIYTGEHTLFGGMIQSTDTVVETSFEKGLKDFGFLLMRITLSLSVVILIVNLLHQKPLTEALLFTLALAVGMAPELLPAITTIAMSAGAKRLLNKKVIVKKLNAIQNLGEVNLLCTDKTGTITEGAVRIETIVDLSGQENEFVKTLSYWNAFFETGYANPIDEAIRALYPNGKEGAEKGGEIPYDFLRKRLSVSVKTNEGFLCISKGAFSNCVNICDRIRLTDGSVVPISEHQREIENQFLTYGEAGKRVLALCYKPISQSSITVDDEQAMIFAGFILVEDPIKKDTQSAIEDLAQLHIDFKMITGDNKIVAQSVGRKMGIQNPVVMTGNDLLSISPEALIQKVKETHIFSEVEPQQKEQIVLALRKSFTVAYMGDGINDVSAIRAADVGISVDNAVDVAREAADFILLEKDLSVIAEGIREGRKTFANTLKYIYINTGSTFGNMCSVAIASLFLPFLPMLPKQILLTNFLTDIPFLFIPSDRVDEQQVDHPGKWNLKVIRKYMIIFGVHSSLFDMITFFVLLYLLRLHESIFQTGWFLESILTELLIFFIIRTRNNFFKSKPSVIITAISVACMLITLLLPYLPWANNLGLQSLSLYQLLSVLSILFAYVLTADLLKVWFFKRFLPIGR